MQTLRMALPFARIKFASTRIGTIASRCIVSGYVAVLHDCAQVYRQMSIEAMIPHIQSSSSINTTNILPRCNVFPSSVTFGSEAVIARDGTESGGILMGERAEVEPKKI